MSDEHMVPLSDGEVRFNAGQQCDMAIGPCACGAWHTENERQTSDGNGKSNE